MHAGGDTSRESLYRALRDIEGADSFLPSPDAAGRALEEFRRCCSNIIEGKGNGDMAAEVASGGTSIKRIEWKETWFTGLQSGYRPSGEIRCEFGRGVPSKQLALALDLSPHSEEVAALWSRFGLDSMDNGWLVAVFKEFSELAKKHGELLWPKFWMDLTGYESFFGAPPVGDANFADQLEEWVATPKPEDGVYSDRRRMVEEGLKELARRPMVFKEQMGVHEWLDNPSGWLANGATTGKRLEGSKGTKFSTYLSSSKEELMRDLLSRAPPRNVVNPKRERTKTRNTISSDWDLYLQMKWLCQGSEKVLETVFPTTLSNKLKQVDRWAAWRRRMFNSVGVPIDQSKFDHVPWMEFIISIIRYMCDCARTKSPEPELHRRITEIVIERIRSASVTWEGHTWRHVRGLLSGWAWTSVLGTLVNYTEFLGVVAVTGCHMPTADSMCFQGDDALLFVESWSQAATLVKTYMRTLPVNPGKFFISSDRTEFLRLVITRDRVTGYLARAIPSLMYANAWAGGKMSVQSRAASWSRLVARGARPERVREHCIRDIAGFTRAPRPHIESCLGTPKSLGGLGLEQGRGVWFRVVEEEFPDQEYEARRVSATDADKVPRHVRYAAAESMRSHGGIFRAPGMADAAAAGMLSGVQGAGWNASLEVRIRFERVVQKVVLSRLCDGRSVNFSPPRPLVDPIFLPNMLRVAMRVGVHAVSKLIDPRDRDLCRGRYMAWPRNVWFDWVVGRISPKAHDQWGLGSVVAAAMKSDLGHELWLPAGRVSRDSIVQATLWSELASHQLRVSEKVWMGA